MHANGPERFVSGERKSSIITHTSIHETVSTSAESRCETKADYLIEKGDRMIPALIFYYSFTQARAPGLI